MTSCDYMWIQMTSVFQVTSAISEEFTYLWIIQVTSGELYWLQVTSSEFKWLHDNSSDFRRTQITVSNGGVNLFELIWVHDISS